MKKILALALALLMALGCMSITAFAKTGAGTEDDPYLFTSLAVNDIIIATDYVKNDTGEILDYEVRYIDRDTLETKNWRPQPNPGQTMQFTFYGYSNDTQFIYKGFDEETALWGGAYVFDVPPTQKIGGTAEITAKIKTAGFEYEIVIPTATTLTEAKHENVLLGTDGKVSITNVKNPTDNVSVSYTVDLTNGELTDGTNTISTTYKYKQGDAEYAAIDGTTKVTVYANKTVNDSFVNVTADEDQWNAAPFGTYNATVVFNFAKEDAAPVISSVKDLIPENFPFSNDPRYWANNAWKNENNRACYSYTSTGNPWLAFSDTNSSGDMDGQILLVCSTPVTKTSNGVYAATQDNITFVFTLTDSVLTSIQLSGSTSHDGTYTAPAALGETYTVTFDTQGHSFPPLPLTGVISGSTISAPIAPLDAGYIFDGWYKEAACTNAWNFDTDTVTADTTLYAKWTMWSPM